MRPAPGEVLHFSEEPTITRFAPDYCFPRQCPRATAWGSAFEPFGEHTHAMVATRAVSLLSPPEPVGDLLALHESAGIQLRLLPNLWEFVDAAAGSSLGFSGIRLRNAASRRGELHP